MYYTHLFFLAFQQAGELRRHVNDLLTTEFTPLNNQEKDRKGNQDGGPLATVESGSSIALSLGVVLLGG